MHVIPCGAAFEAAWLAHAVTDGFTPAHHEPLEEQLEGLRPTDDRGKKWRGKIVMAGRQWIETTVY